MAGLMTQGEVALFADFRNRAEVRRDVLDVVPVIDFSPFVQASSAAERERVAAQIRKACIDIGFFYLANHGIPQAELDEEIRWGHCFFEQPFEEKMKVDKSLVDHRRGGGFMQVGGLKPQANGDAAADLKETFTMNREPLPGEPPGYSMGVGESQWPPSPALAGMRPFLEGQLVKRIALAQRLAQAFALSLGLPETYFDAAHRHIGCNFTYNYYPAMDPGTAPSTQWGISPHTDYGSFTLLHQDELGGLEVRNAAGDWIPVPPIRGTFVVNLGDLFQRWTNDIYTSTLHRAVNFNPEARARISLPFFVYPHASVEIRCLETCQGPDNPPRYEPVNAVEYVRSLIQRSYESGRPGVARETVARLRKLGDAQ